MMSLWDALRMNMMISYQELVRTFLNSWRIKECPVQIEAQVCGISPLTGSQGNLVSVDATITCVHISEALLIRTQRGVKFNVEKWKPLYYLFRHYFSLGHRLGHNFRHDE
ncbi:hypothetical protein DN464_25515 [Enterobacter cloacae]|nr:hypothetical protein DN464_25515 [Enterobacter cloacae]